MFKEISAVVIFMASTLAVAGDGEFAQYDQSNNGSSMVIAKGFADWQASAAYSQWLTTGKSISGSLTKTLAQSDANQQTLKLNVGLGGIDHRSDSNAQVGSASAVGLKVSGESYSRLHVGTVYGLVEMNSAFRSWLAVAQFNPVNSRLSVEWSAVGDDRWYVGHRLALRWQFAGTPWSIRAGRQTDGSAYFVGLSYNSF